MLIAVLTIVQNQGFSVLNTALENGLVNILRILLVHGDIDVNKDTPDDGATPLYIASKLGHGDVVRMPR